VSEPDNYLQSILWRDKKGKELEDYKLDTVTYGTKPASFLFVRAMHQLAIYERDSFPAGSVALQQDFRQSSSSFLCVQTCLKFSVCYFPAVPSAIPMLHWPSFALRMLFAVLLCAVAPIILLA